MLLKGRMGPSSMDWKVSGEATIGKSLFILMFIYALFILFLFGKGRNT